MQIAKYVVSTKIQFDQSSVRKFDSSLKKLEKKLQKFSDKITTKLTLNLSRFKIDDKKLNLALGNALDKASDRVVFEVSRFAVNDRNLQTALLRAGSRASSRITGQQNNSAAKQTSSARELQPRHAIAAGGVGGVAARMYAPALALAGGGYGLAALNQRNQQVVSAQLQTNAVVQQAGGTAAQGAASFDFLRQQGNRIGFNYLEAAPDFNKLISGLTGAGVGLQESQGVFKGFAELARVNKLDKVTQNRLFRALSQVAGKGKLQAEELTGQIAEALPGGTALFAQAYQRQIGGNLTGKDAITQLLDDMKGGKVKSDILLQAGLLASERAQPGLEAASRSSQSEQARFQNQISDTSIRASAAGVESGFARLFRTLNIGLKEAQTFVDPLAKGFDDASKFVSKMVLNIQSLQRFFQGRDSYLGEKLFGTEEQRNQAFTFLETFKNTMSELGKLIDTAASGWERIFQSTGTSPFMSFMTNVLNTITNLAGALNDLANGNFSGAAEKAKAGAFGALRTITSPVRTGLDAAGINATGTFESFAPFDPAAFAANKEAEQRRFLANRRAAGFQGPLGVFPMPSKQEQAQAAMQNYGISQVQGKGAMDIKADVKVTIDAANPEDFNNKFQSQFTSVLEQTLVQYAEKE